MFTITTMPILCNQHQYTYKMLLEFLTVVYRVRDFGESGPNEIEQLKCQNLICMCLRYQNSHLKCEHTMHFCKVCVSMRFGRFDYVVSSLIRFVSFVSCCCIQTKCEQSRESLCFWFVTEEKKKISTFVVRKVDVYI